MSTSPTPDGTTITIAGQLFQGINLPNPLPLPSYEIKTVDHYMSEGSSGTGYKVVQKIGTYYKTFDITLSALTAAQVAALESAAISNNNFNLVIVTPPTTSATYLCCFAAFTPTLPRNAEYPSDLNVTKLSLKILDKTA